MTHWEDYYGLLQVHPQAELDIIQSAYKRLCKKYHPDINASPQAVLMMQRLNQAYETLRDPLSRTRYHAEWTRQNRGSQNAAGTVRERVVYVNRTPAEPAHGGTPAAAKVVEDYFQCLARRDLKGAFMLISQADRQCFGYGAYVEWQESVSNIYELGRVRLKLFKRYDAYKLSDGNKLPAEEYTVTIVEKNRAIGSMQQYDLSKYAVYENGIWRVYLGYRDLTPLKMQFKTMATDPEEIQLLSLWEKYRELNDTEIGLSNRAGFEKDAAREIYRFKRYARPFSMAVFALTLPTGMESERETHIRKYTGYVLEENSRFLDCVGWLGDNCFGVVFVETDRQLAVTTAKRLMNAVRHHVSACFDFDLHICVGLAQYNGGSFQELMDECMATVRAAGGVEETIAGAL